MAPARVHLIDASPYIFRAYFALPASIADAAGQPAQAVYGFASFLLRLMAEEEVTHLGAAFDESLTHSFRNELWPGYKAGRELPPPELEAQQKACQEIARALGAATFVHARYEADDLIGTLAPRLTARGHEVVVVSSDKDLAQLVGPRVTLYDFARGRRLGPQQVRERFGVRPEQVVDWLALAGDPVDDIPGVPGVGSKTAVALLEALGDLDAIYADLDRVAELPLRGASAVARKLEAGRSMAFLSRELATVASDAPVRAGLRELARRPVDAEALEAFGFGTLRARALELDAALDSKP